MAWARWERRGHGRTGSSIVEAQGFRGSIHRGRGARRVVRSALEDEGIEYIAWRHSFRPGEYGLDSLARIVSESDAAILIASPDDRTWYRGQDTSPPVTTCSSSSGTSSKLSAAGGRRSSRWRT